MGRTPQPWYREADGHWYVNIRGQRYKLGTDKTDAHDKFHDLMANRHDLTPKVAVVVLLDKFLDWVERRRGKETYEWYRSRLASFAKHIGKRLTVLELKPHHVTSWIDNAHSKNSPNTVHGAIRCVQRSMNWAVKEGYIGKNPVATVEKPTPTRRELTISHSQFARILAHATDQAERDLLVTLWESGCRVQEIRKVEARHFEPAERRWVFPPSEAEGKKVSRVVYLNDIAFEITERLAKKYPKGPIFRNKNGNPWKRNAIRCRFRKLNNEIEKPCDFCGTAEKNQAIARVRVEVRRRMDKHEKRKHVCLDCKERMQLTSEQVILFPPFVKGFCATAIRHSWITRALMSGIHPITVSVLAGHLNLHMVASRYQHLSKHPDFLLEQLNKLAPKTVSNC